MTFALGVAAGALIIWLIWFAACHLENIHYNRRNSPRRH